MAPTKQVRHAALIAKQSAEGPKGRVIEGDRDTLMGFELGSTLYGLTLEIVNDISILESING